MFLQAVRAYLEGKGIEIAVLMLDGLMVYGDHYDNAPLLEELHTLLRDKHGIEMHFDYKQHETTVLFNEYQAEIQGVIQPALMAIDASSRRASSRTPSRRRGSGRPTGGRPTRRAPSSTSCSATPRTCFSRRCALISKARGSKSRC